MTTKEYREKSPLRIFLGYFGAHKGLFAVDMCCALGIAAGCTVFPQILWKAYCIMLSIQPNVVLTFNWPLSLAVLVV